MFTVFPLILLEITSSACETGNHKKICDSKQAGQGTIDFLKGKPLFFISKNEENHATIAE